MKKYFTIKENDNDYGHIGTEIAETDEELTQKVIEACKSHFDANVKISPLEIENYLFGRSGLVKTKVDISTDDFECEIFIQQTWLY